MKRNKKLNIMREFKLTEISLVDKPAQKHATVAIMKRNDAVEELRDTVQAELDNVMAALGAMKEAAGADLNALGDLLERSQGLNFRLGDDSFDELRFFITELNRNIVELGRVEREQARTRARASSVTGR